MKFQISRRDFLKYSGTLTTLLATNPIELLSKDKPIITFGVVTDSHYADREPAGTRYYRESLEKMKEAMTEMNRLKVNFVVHLGDFKDESESPTEQSTLSYLTEVEKSFAVFKGPRYHVLGNHDIDSISKTQFQAHITNTGIAKDKTWYSFDRNGIHFVVLDANYRQDGVVYDKGNFTWNDSLIPDEELHWLKEDLSKNSLPVIVFVHQLLDNVSDYDHCVKNAEDTRKILAESKKVLVVFQGHCHKERYHKLDNIHFCSLPGMVDHSGLANNSFSVIEVYKTGNINMIGFKRAPDRRMGL